MKRPPIAPTSAEINALLAATSARSMTAYRSRAMILAMARCGLRVGELVKMTPGDVDLVTGELRVRFAKAGKARSVAADAVTIDTVAAWASRRAALGYSDDQPLFCRIKDGQGLTTSGVRVWLRRLVAKAGVRTRISPHSLRHHFSSVISRQIPLVDVMAALGHQNLATTQRYITSMGGDQMALRSVRWE